MQGPGCGLNVRLEGMGVRKLGVSLKGGGVRIWDLGKFRVEALGVWIGLQGFGRISSVFFEGGCGALGYAYFVNISGVQTHVDFSTASSGL